MICSLFALQTSLMFILRHAYRHTFEQHAVILLEASRPPPWSHIIFTSSAILRRFPVSDLSFCVDVINYCSDDEKYYYDTLNQNFNLILGLYSPRRRAPMHY